MKINIYTAFNGVGLERDYEIIKNRLIKHQVQGYDWLKRETGKRADINIHLEIPRYECFKYAAKNILIPNPEWFSPNWVNRVSLFSEVWCKTRDCYQIFRKLNPRAIHSGFMSDDFYDSTIKKEKTLIHVAGKSHTKGTQEICEAYKRKPDLPPCLIISSIKWDVSGNLTQKDRIPFAELKENLNRNMIHLCPSSYEGWGHYLHESFSTGSCVITTNHAPMNEFTLTNLVKVKEIKPMNIAKIGIVDVNSLIESIEKTYAMSDIELENQGNRNRENFLNRNKNFKEFIRGRIL